MKSLPYHSIKSNCLISQLGSIICIHHEVIGHIWAPIERWCRCLECQSCCCSSQRIVVHGNRVCLEDSLECCMIDI